MIVSRSAAGLCVVLQVDHQEQCGVMARAWGNADFRRLDPWAPVVRAAAVHDEGWRGWEARPEIDAEGRPLDFPDLDRARHVELYRAGVASAFAEDRLVGLLVSMHGEGLYRSRPGLEGPGGSGEGLLPEARAFADEQRRVQESALAERGGERWRAWASDAYRLLQAWDALSLYLTWSGLPKGRPGRLRAVPTGPGGERVDLLLSPAGGWAAACEPFPFPGREVELPVRARTVPDRPFASHEGLREALSAAPDEIRRYRVVHP